ncbi:MAG: dephospho-CoA kinase [Pseudomonadota bacterium]|jgi:dephospho-CoA kinase|nr:dephospho-CoA kinase [Pseudomonadota bacterium]
MFVVGLTGGIGSGKSTVAGMFAALEIDLIDADVAAREVVAPGTTALAEIVEHFGPDILMADGSLDRRGLRRIIFHQKQEKHWLETLLHPLIRRWLTQQISDRRSAYCLLISPLLLETGQAEMVDRILVVDVSVETQIARTLARDGGEESTVRAIIAAQIGRNQRLEHGDDIIDNDLPLQTLRQRVETLHQQYLTLAKAKRNE